MVVLAPGASREDAPGFVSLHEALRRVTLATVLALCLSGELAAQNIPRDEYIRFITLAY